MPHSNRLRARLHALGLACLLLAGAPAWAQEDTGDWLGRMAEAMRNVAYQGTLVYAYNGEMETLSVVHGKIDGKEHERIRALTGEPFEVIRDGESIRCLWPSSERMLLSQSPANLLPSGLPQGLQSLPGLYRAEVEDVSRIAGRIARVIRVRASDGFRYGYRLWVDRESHMLLRSDLIAPDGEIVERLMFTRFRVLDEVHPAQFEPTHTDREYVEYSAPEAAGESVGEPAWRVTDLPPGFHKVVHRRQAMPPHGRSVQQSVFSDGLASVSVFVEEVGPGEQAGGGPGAGQEPSTATLAGVSAKAGAAAASDHAEPFQGAAAMGALNAFVTRTDNSAITVVGEVPPITVRQIARAVERADRQAAR